MGSILKRGTKGYTKFRAGLERTVSGSRRQSDPGGRKLRAKREQRQQSRL